MPEEWADLEHEALRTRRRAIDVWTALFAAVGSAAPLAIGVAIGNKELGLFGALGGLNTALAISSTTRSERAKWGGTALLAGIASVGLATLTHPVAWLATGATLVWSSWWALLRVTGPHGTAVAFGTTAVFIVSNGSPGAPRDAVARMAAYAVGGAASLVLLLLPRRSGGHGSATEALAWSLVVRTLWSGGIARRHAVAVGVVTAAGTAFYRVLDLTYGYWIPLSAVAVLQPDAHSSRVRALQRALGTVAGVVAVAVVAAVTSDDWVLVVISFLTSFGLFALRDRGYQWFVMLLTPTVLLMISVVSYRGWSIAVDRMVNTLIGIAVAMVAIGIITVVKHPGPARRG